MTTGRPIAILKLPEYHVPEWITRAVSIMNAMTNNPWFPAPVPSLAEVDVAVRALEDAEAARISRTVGTVPTRNVKRKQLKGLLERLCSYVQWIADNNPESAVAIIESAGMYVKGKGGRHAQIFTALPGLHSGEVIVVCPKAKTRAGYGWDYSIDGGKTWVLLPVTVKARTTVTGLPSGDTAYFRYRVSTNKGTSDWSEPVSCKVP